MRFRRAGLPQDGAATVAEHLAVRPSLTRHGQEGLLRDTDALLSSKRWEAAQGLGVNRALAALASWTTALVWGTSAASATPGGPAATARR